MSRDPRIDAYIEKAQPFARPILDHVRAIVHAACPDVAETIKWGMPSFTYRDRILGVMAGHKAHASFALWRLGEAAGPARVDKNGMGSFGKLAGLADLPDDATLTGHIQAAMRIIAEGPAPQPKKPPRAELPVPDELAAALAGAPAAQATFDDFSPSNRRDYCEWIGEAKRPETRAARVAQAIEWLAEGKPRHWKYQR